MVRSYRVVVVFAVDEHADTHLADEPTIADEVRSWLEDLGAQVSRVIVTPQLADEKTGDAY